MPGFYLRRHSLRMTTIDTLKQHAPELLQTPTFQDNPILLQQIQAAMKQYAEEKAKHYARFFYDRAYYYSLWEKEFNWDTYTKEHPMK